MKGELWPQMNTSLAFLFEERSWMWHYDAEDLGRGTGVFWRVPGRR